VALTQATPFRSECLTYAESLLQVVIGGDDFDDLNVGSNRLPEALDPLIEIERSEPTSDDPDLAGAAERFTHGFTLNLARGLVVGADVHDPVAIGRVRVEGHHQDALAHAVVDQVDHRGRLVR
jgi:hypothetical protein